METIKDLLWYRKDLIDIQNADQLIFRLQDPFEVFFLYAAHIGWDRPDIGGLCLNDFSDFIYQKVRTRDPQAAVQLKKQLGQHPTNQRIS